MRKRLYTPVLLILFFAALAAHAEAPVTSFVGTIDDANPFVEYPVVVAQDSSTISLDLTATDGDLDTLLYLVDENGIILAENDDRVKGNSDSALTMPHLRAGNYRVVATRYDIEKGDSSGTYELNVNVLPDATTSAFHYDVSAGALKAVGYPATAAHETADWTILAYYAADTNLEAAIINDLDEFEVGGGSNARIRVIVLLDRSPDYSDSNGDWSDVRVFEVQNDVTGDHLTEYPPTIDTAPLANLGEQNTGDGLTLAQFLVWGVQTYPAQHYAIAIGSHGAGWRGLSVDETSGAETDTDYTIVTIPQLREALNLAQYAAGVDKFDLLINDACLMSSIEYHTAMKPYFHLSLASAEIVVNPALDMSLLTKTLDAVTQTDLTTLGTQLVDQYILTDIFQRDSGSTEFYTDALTNLDHYDPVTASVEAFATLVSSTPNIYIDTLGRARANTYTYTAFMGESTLVDLGHFMEQVIIASSDVKLMGAAQKVLETLEAARLHGNAGETAAKWSYYYNIYFPADSDDFDTRYADESPLPEWNRMLQTYFSLTTERLWAVEDSVLVYHPASAPKVQITQLYPAISSPANPPTIRMEVEGRRIARGTFTVDTLLPDGRTARLLNTAILTEVVIGDTVNFVNQWRSGVDQSSFSWLPMTLTSVSDGSTTAYELLQKSGDIAILEGRTREPGQEDWHDIAVMFSLETHKVARVINRARGTGALAEITPSEGAEFQAYQQIVTSNGETKAEPGTLYRWSDDLSWTEQTAPTGTYELGFLVETYSGLAGFDSVTVEVQADSSATQALGYTALDLGVTFEYPQGWLLPFDTGTQIVTNSPDASQTISLIYFNAAEDNAWKIVEDYQVLYGLTPEGMGEMVDFNGQMAVTFAYSYLLDEQTWYGRGLAFYRTTLDRGGTGIILSAETQNPEERDALYQSFADHLSVFDAVAVDAENQGMWQYRFLLPDIAHPIPLTWNTNPTTEVGKWGVFAAPDTPRTTASIAYFETKDAEAIFDQQVEELHVGQGEQRVLDYQNSFRHWRIAEYRTPDDKLGRLYVTNIGEYVFALRFETPDDDTALAFVRDVFEPMVDGFAPLNNVQYALGGINPVTLKAVMSRASLACDKIDVNDACYGEGSVIVEAVTTIIEDDGFTNTGDTIQIPVLKELGVGISTQLENTFDSLSIAVLDALIPARETEDESEAAVRMGVFGGIVITQPINAETEGGN